MWDCGGEKHKENQNGWSGFLQDKYIQKSKNNYPSQESLRPQQTRNYKGVSERSNLSLVTHFLISYD